MFKFIKALVLVAIKLLNLQKYQKPAKLLIENNNWDEAKKILSFVVKDFGDAAMDAIGNPIEVIGEENVDKSETYLIVANHQSYIDIPLIFSKVGVFTGFIGRENLVKLPLIGNWLKVGFCGLLDRDNPRNALATINASAELLKKGISQTIFPEGTRTLDGDVHEFKPGAFKLATKAKVRILPVAIIGNFEIMRKGSKTIKSGPIKMVILPPISTESRNTQDLATESQQVISSALRAYS